MNNQGLQHFRFEIVPEQTLPDNTRQYRADLDIDGKRYATTLIHQLPITQSELSYIMRRIQSEIENALGLPI